MSALDELRESLREAARRDVDANRVRRRRRHRRTTAVVVLALLGGGAAAGAADLISVGKPLGDIPGRNPAYRPAGATDLQIALKASSGDVLPYGVVTYTARNGDRCAMAGVIRGAQLGLMDGATFRPYSAERTGACRTGQLQFSDLLKLGSHSLLFGRATPSTRFVRLPLLNRRIAVGQGGAFLFVLTNVEHGERLDIVPEE
jgi:hypothetical protein